jgi:hypothetical protein
MINSNSTLTKLLVRHTKVKKFLNSTGRWTRKAEAALNFPHLFNAIHTCLLCRVREVELVLRFKGDKADRRFRVEIA